jgi:ketopantoate reductase
MYRGYPKTFHHLAKFTPRSVSERFRNQKHFNLSISNRELFNRNAAWNALTSLTLLNTHQWLTSEGGMGMTRQLMTEVIEVAQRCGVPLSYDLTDQLIDKILKMPGIFSSMHADRVAGRQMEVDIILGTPVKKAKEFGMKVPIIETLYTLLTALNVRLQIDQEVTSNGTK